MTMTSKSETLVQAQEALRSGDTALAETLLRDLLAEAPEEFGALRGLAAAIKDQDPQGAEQLRRQADSIESALLTDTAASLHVSGLTDKAKAVAAKAHDLDPANTEAMRLQADFERAQGNLDAATSHLQILRSVDPDHALASHTFDILQNRGVVADAPLDQAWPIPYVRLRNFLPTERVEWLFRYLNENRSEFNPTTVVRKNRSVVATKTRQSKMMTPQADLRDWFLPMVRQALEAHFADLGLKPFDVQRIEMQVTASGDGEFYGIHRDSILNRKGEMIKSKKNSKNYLETRAASFVYYFSRVPQPFTGGNLHLHDSAPKFFLRHRYTALSPDHNSLVLFPSACAHQVAPVSCDSDDFYDGRFTINGWIHADRDSPVHVWARCYDEAAEDSDDDDTADIESLSLPDEDLNS